MITYVDTSTLMKLIIDEDGSDRAGLVWDAADSLVSVRLISVESHAALAAAVRNGRISMGQFETAKRGLADFVDSLHLVEVTETLVNDAGQLAEDEALRGYDAVHLAAALLVSATIFTSADLTLCEAASRRGLHVANPIEK